MKKTLIIIGFLLISLASWAQGSYVDTITEANNAYNEGRYIQAIDFYNSAVARGLVSSNLYYNLGNAYFKINDIPNAILFYEKAKKIDPRDEDILYNLQIANSQKVDKIESVPELFYISWWHSITKLLSVNTWALISVSCFFLIFIFGGIFITTNYYKTKKTTFWLGIIAIVFFLISIWISYQEYKEFRNDNYAVVFTPTITVKSSPAENSVDLFVVHEGTKVEIIDNVEGWYEVKIANGSSGWLPSFSVEKI